MLQVQPDGLDFVIPYRRMQPVTIGDMTFPRMVGHGQERFMWCHPWIALQTKIDVNTGPGVMLWCEDHVGTDRIQFDISVNGEQVLVGADETGFETAFP